jgi:hypothetical protein
MAFAPITVSVNKDGDISCTSKFESGVVFNFAEFTIIQSEKHYMIHGFCLEADPTAFDNMNDKAWKWENEKPITLKIKRITSEFNGKEYPPHPTELAICKYLDKEYATKFKDKFFKCEEFELGGSKTQSKIKASFEAEEIEEIDKADLVHLKDFNPEKLTKSSGGGFNRGGSGGVSPEKKLEFIQSQLNDDIKAINECKTLMEISMALFSYSLNGEGEMSVVKHFYTLLGLTLGSSTNINPFESQIVYDK